METTKIQGKLLFDILSAGNIAGMSLTNALSRQVLNILVKSASAKENKSKMVSYCAAFIGPKDLEISEKTLKDIENKVYNKMIRNLEPFMYQTINIVPKREFFKLIIDTKNAFENKDENNGIDKNGKSNETLLYSIEVLNPFNYLDIDYKDLDKYFDCYINNNKIKNISIKTIYRNQIRLLSMGVLNNIEHSFKINAEHTCIMIKPDETKRCEIKYRVSTIANTITDGMVDFNDITNSCVGFIKSEIKNSLELDLNNICKYGIPKNEGYELSIKIGKVDLYPAEPSNLFFGFNLCVCIDYTVCIEKE